MKNSLLQFAAICCILIIPSCNNSDDEAGDFAILSVKEAIDSKRDVLLSEFASSVEYIPLETKDSSLIANLTRPVLIDGIFYIMDNKGVDIKRFGRDGKFLGYIGRSGRAKGEFLSASPFNFFIDKEKRHPHIFNNGKLIEYDREGNFVKEIFSPDLKNRNVHLFKMVKFANHYFTHVIEQTSGKSYLIIVDSTGTPLNPIPDFEKPVSYMIPENSDAPVVFRTTSPAHIYYYNNVMRVVNPDCDTIFTFDNSLKKSVSYVIDYGSYKKAESSINDDRQSGIYTTTSFTTETKNAIFFTMRIGENIMRSEFGQRFRAVYDKRSGKFTLLLKRNNSDAMINDIDGGAPFWPINLSPEGEMVMTMTAIEFISAAEKSSSAEMKRVASFITEESNPVMIVARTAN